MSQKVINLTLADHVLTGKYSKEDDKVLVVLNSSEGVGYTVTLPDLTATDNIEFSFKNIPFGNTGADITIQTANNQLVDGINYSFTVTPYSIQRVVSNKVNTWVLMNTDNNSIVSNPFYLGKNGLRLWRLFIDSTGKLNIDYDTLAGVAASPVWSSGYVQWDGKGTFA